MLADAWQQIVHAVSHEPATLLLEFVQFIILVFLVKLVAVGTASRRGIVVNMLDERRARITDDLEEAERHVAEAHTARERAAEVLARARAESERIAGEADEQAVQEREKTRAETEAEVAQTVQQVETALERERSEVLGDVRDSLLDVVAGATRVVLNEGFSPTQQRVMIQDAILASLDDLESAAMG